MNVAQVNQIAYIETVRSMLSASFLIAAEDFRNDPGFEVQAGCFEPEQMSDAEVMDWFRSMLSGSGYMSFQLRPNDDAPQVLVIPVLR